jgi:hypothetical protein
LQLILEDIKESEQAVSHGHFLQRTMASRTNTRNETKRHKRALLQQELDTDMQQLSGKGANIGSRRDIATCEKRDLLSVQNSMYEEDPVLAGMAPLYKGAQIPPKTTARLKIPALPFVSAPLRPTSRMHAPRRAFHPTPM